MKFNVTVTDICCNKEYAEKLSKWGFKFNYLYSDIKNHEAIEATEFDADVAYFVKDDITLEIKTIKELMSLTQYVGKIILYGNEIEIYNGYRE